VTLKTIRSPADLAIHGAPPAFDDPLHVGRPNIGDKDTILEQIAEILERKWLTNNGPVVQEFERSIADRLGVKHCIAMCNGTIALEIAIRALGLSGEVIVPSWTFVATAHALHWQGITPVFADVDGSTQNLDPVSVERMITPRTTGIIGVHLWGRAAPIDALQALANRHGLKLMFDAAHAFGSTYKQRSIGQFGACEVLSFHATKAFNSMEGGAVVTNNDELAQAMQLMRNFGFIGYDDVAYPGTNGKMIEACAAVGLVNLKSLDDTFDHNRSNYAAYVRELAGIEGITVLPYDPAEHNSHHYVVIMVNGHSNASRDQILSALHAENVLARKYFWPGVHMMQPYRDLQPNAGHHLPQTLAVAEQVIVLPTGTAVNECDIKTVADIVRMAGHRT
jgi:dTDP-4-amino-4,6-dideoxygalactose transaminase